MRFHYRNKKTTADNCIYANHYSILIRTLFPHSSTWRKLFPQKGNPYRPICFSSSWYIGPYLLKLISGNFSLDRTSSSESQSLFPSLTLHRTLPPILKAFTSKNSVCYCRKFRFKPASDFTSKPTFLKVLLESRVPPLFRFLTSL